MSSQVPACRPCLASLFTASQPQENPIELAEREGSSVMSDPLLVAEGGSAVTCS